MDTRTNANSVPMLVRLYVSPASPISDHSPTKMPVISVVIWGTRVVGWTFAAQGGSRPSRPIAKKMRGWPYWNTSSTADIEMIAPRATIQPTVLNPALFSALASGSATPSSVYGTIPVRSEEHTSELQSRLHLVCRLLLEKKKHACTRAG